MFTLSMYVVQQQRSLTCFLTPKSAQSNQERRPGDEWSCLKTEYRGIREKHIREHIQQTFHRLLLIRALEISHSYCKAQQAFMLAGMWSLLFDLCENAFRVCSVISNIYEC
ncbi:hypothetical protein CHARACLAT_025459 [Characodon lateralis]|uniref:Uncharacterized protein n=1 Tax=Characodon lateralis TaxID=208331 RepID=A0ABU7EQF1_9TELE|nr:hypothetical protein [Characodon lateralis]